MRVIFAGPARVVLLYSLFAVLAGFISHRSAVVTDKNHYFDYVRRNNSATVAHTSAAPPDRPGVLRTRCVYKTVRERC